MLNGPCRNAPVQKLSKLREAMRFTSRSRAPLLLSLSKQRMDPSQRRSRIASPRAEARCTERRVVDHAIRLEEGGSHDHKHDVRCSELHRGEMRFYFSVETEPFAACS